MKKVTIVINKNWEAEPALNAMTNYHVKPKDFPYPNWINSPKDPNSRMNSPRAVYLLNGATPLQVTVWCLQDLMNPNKSASSSEEKYRVLPPVLTVEQPDLVIAVGTAAYPDISTSFNGRVFIGGQFFMYDGHPGNPNSNFISPLFGQVIPSNVSAELFNLLTSTWSASVVQNFLPLTKSPTTPEIVADRDYISIGDLNITDYNEYPLADPAALAAYHALGSASTAVSMETTHGIIRLSSDAPTIFLSTIVNRLTKLSDDGVPIQTYAAGFNAGVTLAHLLSLLVKSPAINF